MSSSTNAPAQNLCSTSVANIVHAQPAQSYACVPGTATDASDDNANVAPAADATLTLAVSTTAAPDATGKDNETSAALTSAAVVAAVDASKPAAARACKVTLTKLAKKVTQFVVHRIALTPSQTTTTTTNEPNETVDTGDDDTRPGEPPSPSEAPPALAQALAQDLDIFTTEENNLVQELRAKENSLQNMAPIPKKKAPVPTHDIPEEFGAGEKWETVKQRSEKGKGKARAVSLTPSLSSLMEDDRSPSLGPSRAWACFVAGACHSPKHCRGSSSGSDSDDRSTTCAHSPPLKKSRENEFGAFRVTSPPPEHSRSPTPFTNNAVPDNEKDDTTFYEDLPQVHDQDPAAFVSKKNPQQAALWNKIDGDKICVLVSWLNKASAASTVHNMIAHHLAINPDSFNVSQAIGDPQSLIVSGLQPALASQLMVKKGCTSSSTYICFCKFKLEVPHYIGTLSGFASGLSSPEQMKQTVTEVYLGIQAEIASDTGIHALVAKYHDLAPLWMPAMTIAKHMADYLWVEPIDIRVTSSDVETAYNVYCHHPSNHPDYMAKLHSVITKHEFLVVTEYNKEGRFLRNLFKCGICFGIDHPTGLCVLPCLDHWNGLMPLSLDTQ
ncbi:hypothetical protein C8J56DRAFT_896235 [Mycena floridula]|nr:hypothetical protein C8J56DRAFT_896235 [Mycena floridula]